MTTTGRTCYWRNVPPGRDPGFVSDKQYSNMRDVKRRNRRDPRPTAVAKRGPMSVKDLAQLKTNLAKTTPSSLLLHHIEACLEEREGLEDESEVNSEIIEDTAVKCSRLMWELNRKCVGKDAPFEVPSTHGQSDNPNWKKERSIICTAYDNKQFLGLSTGESKKKYLRKKIWGLDNYVSKAMQEGKETEAQGRELYAKYVSRIDSNFSIEETGLWKNPKYPQLGCSPDGFVKHPFYPEPILLEIKRLTKGHVNPAKFEEQMTHDEKKSFYLYRDSNGTLQIKKAHLYYHQIQMSLNVVELEWAHIFVFSESGSAVVAVRYDSTFWTERRTRLIKRHRELLLPEAVLKRTLRHREPVEIMYPNFHEDGTDDFFLNE